MLTKHIPGKKKDRCLHPKIREHLERSLFGGVALPYSFQGRFVPEMIVDTCYAMSRLLILEKGGNNMGQEVGWIQSVIGSDSEVGTGEPWCMSLVQNIVAFVEDFLGVESPIIASESCMEVKRAAEKIPGLLSPTAQEGSIYLLGYSEWKGHTGIALELFPSRGRMTTYEGNTSNSSVNDGNGAFIRDRPISGKIGLGTIHGFALMYPNNEIPEVRK